MKFLGNSGDPRLCYMVFAPLPGGTLDTARARVINWLSDKIIGEPQATEKYTVEELKRMGIIGVYYNE